LPFVNAAFCYRLSVITFLLLPFCYCLFVIALCHCPLSSPLLLPFGSLLFLFVVALFDLCLFVVAFLLSSFAEGGGSAFAFLLLLFCFCFFAFAFAFALAFVFVFVFVRAPPFATFTSGCLSHTFQPK